MHVLCRGADIILIAASRDIVERAKLPEDVILGTDVLSDSQRAYLRDTINDLGMCDPFFGPKGWKLVLH